MHGFHRRRQKRIKEKESRGLRHPRPSDPLPRGDSPKFSENTESGRKKDEGRRTAATTKWREHFFQIFFYFFPRRLSGSVVMPQLRRRQALLSKPSKLRLFKSLRFLTFFFLSRLTRADILQPGPFPSYRYFHLSPSFTSPLFYF